MLVMENPCVRGNVCSFRMCLSTACMRTCACAVQMLELVLQTFLSDVGLPTPNKWTLAYNVHTARRLRAKLLAMQAALRQKGSSCEAFETSERRESADTALKAAMHMVHRRDVPAEADAYVVVTCDVGAQAAPPIKLSQTRFMLLHFSYRLRCPLTSSACIMVLHKLGGDSKLSEHQMLMRMQATPRTWRT